MSTIVPMVKVKGKLPPEVFSIPANSNCPPPGSNSVVEKTLISVLSTTPVTVIVALALRMLSLLPKARAASRVEVLVTLIAVE